MKLRLDISALVLFSLSVVTTGCQYTRGNVVSASAKQDELSTYHSLIRSAQLENVLAKDGPYTIFAPTNEAFGKLPDGMLADLHREDYRDDLILILTYHIVPGEIMYDALQSGQILTTQSGAQVHIGQSRGRLTYGDARIIEPDIKATNGVIHVVDKVQIPPNLKLRVGK